MDQSGFRLADITTTNLAMPYKLNKETGSFEPYFQYGYPDYPDGALRTSAVHLARWLAAFMNYGSFEGVRVLERSTVRETRRHQLSYDAGWRQGLVWYGAAPRGYFRMGHTGGDFGVSTRMFFRPDTRVRRRDAHELLPRRPAMGRVPGDRPQAPRGARVAFRSRAPSSSRVD